MKESLRCADSYSEATAVARIDNLQFLDDVIPQTTTYRQFKAKKAKAAQNTQPLQNGQTTLDAARSLLQRLIPPSAAQGEPIDDGNMSDGTIDAQTAEENPPGNSNTKGGLVFEHYEPNGTSRRDESGDVEMG